MINELQTKVKELQKQIHRTASVDEKINLTRELYKSKLHLLDLIHEKDKARAGMTARELIAKVKSMPKLPKFETGMSKIDASFGGGFETGLFINLAGESGAGKTTLLMNLLANLSQGRKTVFFNFEMGDRLFVKKLEDLKLNDSQLDNLIIDSDTNKLEDLIMEIELYAEDNIKFFAIDSKMKIYSNSQGQEYQQISNMSKELSRLSARKDIVIFLINQMNEEDIKNKRLAFKGSGDQKYDSDIALFLVKENEQRKLICTKNRMNDRLFSIDLSINDYKNGNKPVEIEFVSDDELDSSFDISSFDVLNG
jgi:KaiC/GvpD/RAD55 family RecA-like ATPase